MSTAAMEYAWGKAGLTGTEKLVLVSLADHANLDGEAIFPKVDRIVRRTGLSRSTVMDTRRRLEKKELIERTERKVAGVIEYRLTEYRGPGDGHPDPPQGSSTAVEGSSTAVEGVREPDPEQQQNGQEQKAPPAPPARKPTAVDQVWAVYVEVMEPRRKDLDEENRTIIRDALRAATTEECCLAIRGCRSSSFHMGSNDKRRKYNAVSQILKGKRAGRTTREQIDFFIDLAEQNGLSSGLESGLTSVDPARLSQAKRSVLDAWEFPGDETVVRRGDEAEAWLVEQGVRVVRSEGERPRFESS